MLVHRFELVWKRVDAGDGKPEIGIEFVGDAQSISLESDAQKPSVAGIGKSLVGDGQASDVSGRKYGLTEPLRLRADKASFQMISIVGANGYYAHRFVEQRASQYLPFADGWRLAYGHHQSLSSRRSIAPA